MEYYSNWGWNKGVVFLFSMWCKNPSKARILFWRWHNSRLPTFNNSRCKRRTAHSWAAHSVRHTLFWAVTTHCPTHTAFSRKYKSETLAGCKSPAATIRCSLDRNLFADYGEPPHRPFRFPVFGHCRQRGDRIFRINHRLRFTYVYMKRCLYVVMCRCVLVFLAFCLCFARGTMAAFGDGEGRDRMKSAIVFISEGLSLL